MAYITARLCVHESSRPLSNLQLTWYLTPKSDIPSDYFDSYNWNSLRKCNWERLQLTRLGSSITDIEGISCLQYSINKSDPSDKHRQNIWYIVQLPEVAGEALGGGVIHVGSEVIVNPSTNEEIQIRFPEHIIEKFGVEDKRSPNFDSRMTGADLDVSLEKIEKEFVKNKVKEGARFSKKFNEELAIKKEEENNNPLSPIPMKVILPISLEMLNSKKNSEINIGFDKRKSKLVLKNNANEIVNTLNYKGVSRYIRKSLKNENLFGPQILVNEVSGDLHLLLPKVPEVLELTELELSPLYKHTQGILKSIKKESENG